VLDPVYGGKAFHGLLRELADGRFADARNILFIHTGGIFGLPPYADALPV
jgi:D-cysteine desulfhydrase